MSVSPAFTFPPAAESQAEAGNVRPEQTRVVPPPGAVSIGESDRSQNAETSGATPQDEVKLQWDTSDRVVIYQFVNQQGSLILQVPSEQMLNLGREISQELAQQVAPREKEAAEGGKTNGR